MIRRHKSLWALGCALVIAMACCVQSASAQSIGSAAVIRNDVQGVRGSATRVLASGGSVFSDDQVRTGDNSLAQLVFLDQTNLTVAANSQAVLKEVYRPKQGYSQLIMRTVAGSFRYVSGAQSSHHDVVQFPQGYLTVRGTTVDIVAGRTRTLIILVEGAITVVPNATGRPINLDVPGQSVIVYNDHVEGPMTREAALERLHLTVASLAVPTQPVTIGAPSNFAGLDVGGVVGGSRSSITYKEFQALTGEQTSNQNSFGTSRVSAGGHVGFMIPVITNAQGGATALGLVIEPFVQLVDPNTSAQFNVSSGGISGGVSGSFSVQSNFEVTAGVKAGPTLSLSGGMPVWLYGTVAASFENEKLTVNFVPTSSSENKTIAGLTVGFGGAVMPAGLQLFGMPIAFSVEYQHTFWQPAHFDMPASSPFFNYIFSRGDDIVMAGVRVIVR